MLFTGVTEQKWLAMDNDPLIIEEARQLYKQSIKLVQHYSQGRSHWRAASPPPLQSFCKNNLSLKFRGLINLKQLRWTIANEIAQTGKLYVLMLFFDYQTSIKFLSTSCGISGILYIKISP